MNSFQPEYPPYYFLLFNFCNKNIMVWVSFTGCPCFSPWSQWFTDGINVVLRICHNTNFCAVGGTEGLKIRICVPLTCSKSYKNTSLLTKNAVNRLLESNLDGSICPTNISSYFLLYTELGMDIFVLINNITGFVFMIMKF
jgi:hypothetical protein